jgi:REP-associated tyrosine transposase
MIFGDIVEGTMLLNRPGECAAQSWEWLGRRHDRVSLDAWIIMPNHLHGVIIFDDRTEGGSRTAPTPSKEKPLGRRIGAFKTLSTKRINQIRGTPGTPVWQRNYYEHVIRDENELNRIRTYIEANPAMWNMDDENPAAMSRRNEPGDIS